MGRNRLEQRTTELLAEPVERICNLGTKMEAELRAHEVTDPNLRAWLATVLDWRQDFVDAGRYARPSTPRHGIYSSACGGELAGWFKQWAHRRGPATTVWYNAVIVLAALS